MHNILLVQQDTVGTNENKIRVWTVLWTIIRKPSNHCQDVNNCGDEDHCQYHLGIDHCQTENRIESTVRMEMSMQIDDQDQRSALKCINLIIS